MHLIYSRLTAKGEEVKGKKQKTPDARAREKRGDLASRSPLRVSGSDRWNIGRSTSLRIRMPSRKKRTLKKKKVLPAAGQETDTTTNAMAGWNTRARGEEESRTTKLGHPLDGIRHLMTRRVMPVRPFLSLRHRNNKKNAAIETIAAF